MLAADKIFGFVFALMVLTPAAAGAATCFRSANDIRVAGVAGGTTLTVFWNDNGDAVDEVRLEKDGLRVGADMFCFAHAPIRCNLGEDGGHVRLIFDGSRLKVISSGLQVTRDEARRARLSTRRQNISLVHELTQISAVECRMAFPNPRTIEVIPTPQVPAALR